MLDGVDPEVIEELRHAATHVAGVEKVTDVRARWLGHRLRAEVNIAVSPSLRVAEGHAVAKEVRHEMMHHPELSSDAMIHVDPAEEAGEKFHRIEEAFARRPAGPFALDLRHAFSCAVSRLPGSCSYMGADKR